MYILKCFPASKGDFRQLFLSMKFIQINPTLYIVASYKKNYFEPSKGFASDGYEPWKGGTFYKINAFAQSS